ncbi:MAG: endo-1,4-beta-xylanase [Vicinamibacteria bacterium]
MRLPALALLLAASASAAEPPALKDLAPKGVRIGAALNRDTIEGKDPVSAAIVAKHFDTVTSENILKWALVHPEPTRYEFGPADAYVELGRKHGQQVIGHTLVWHNQTPKWVFEGKDGKRVDRDTLLARMREHIRTVVGRYRGRIAGWDVCNEVITEEGALRKSPWFEIAGEDYIAEAFKAAHEADPDAELYYNDYNLYKPAKRAAAIALVKKLRAQGLRVDALGEQGHWQLATPAVAEIQAIFDDAAAAGLPVVITELDVDVLPRDPAMAGADLANRFDRTDANDPYRDGLPADKQDALAKRYADAFALFVKNQANLRRVTFWGVTDARSWLNNFPVRGRVNHPLLWDRDGKEKPAFSAVAAALNAR